MPPHFCLKAFSLGEGLSTAFLSNSSQQDWRFSCEPEFFGTVTGRECEKGHHSGPQLLRTLGQQPGSAGLSRLPTWLFLCCLCLLFLVSSEGLKGPEAASSFQTSTQGPSLP